MAALCTYFCVHLKRFLLLFVYGNVEMFKGIRDIVTENLPVQHQLPEALITPHL